MIFHCIVVDLTFIPEACNPVTDQVLEEIQITSSQEESTHETTGTDNIIIIFLVMYMS